MQQPDPFLHSPPQPLFAPQSLPAHVGVQQPPILHLPPQPSAAPQFFPVQFGVQQPEPGPHVPPQASLAPQSLPLQAGSQQPDPSLQSPPQPSAELHFFWAQFGVQPVHLPALQVEPLLLQSAQGDPLAPHC